MRLSWFIWLFVTALVALYVWAGAVASSTETISIKIERGYSAEISVFRLAEDRLRMRLVFQGDHARRQELGTSSTRSDWNLTGSLKFDNPGAAIRIVASMPGVTPVTYEAMPTSGWGLSNVVRDLTASLSISPGVWRWPPTKNELVLHPGGNVVKIEVVGVEPPLIGEAVELSVDPALGFKQSMPNVAWLWAWFLWPLLCAIQLLWAATIGLLEWKIRVRNT